MCTWPVFIYKIDIISCCERTYKNSVVQYYNNARVDEMACTSAVSCEQNNTSITPNARIVLQNKKLELRNGWI